MESARPDLADSTNQAEQLYQSGAYDRAAQAWTELAAQQRGEAAAWSRLRAAEALREAGDLDGAARIAARIGRRQLHGNALARLQLLQAEVALGGGDATGAREELAGLPSQLPPALEARALELRARSAAATGDRLAEAQQRALLDPLLRGTDRAGNRDALLAALAGLDTGTLEARGRALADDDALLPWISRVLGQRGHPLARDGWRPERPVGTLQRDDQGTLEAEGYRPSRRVALLLPLGSNLAAVAQPIRDGFLAAHFALPVDERPALVIHAVDRDPTTALAAYADAVAEGAEVVVGPLQREAVTALFQQPLPVPVLALNHPDNDLPPPPGSAEFGLAPEAEGAEVARHMLERGIVRAALILSGQDWARRAADAFRDRFVAGGGSVAASAELPEGEVRYADAIGSVKNALGGDGNAGIFISMRPQQARMLMPQLRIAGVGLPVFATSHIHSAQANPTLDRDLDGVEFCDAPWLFRPLAGRPDREVVDRRLASAGGAGARLFAFGLDAAALVPYIDWLLTHRDSYLGGATGDLSADPFGRIRRRPGWARFSNGVARPLDGALSTAPVGQ